MTPTTRKALAAATALLIAPALAGAAQAAPLDVPATKAAIDAQLDRDYPQLDALYKHLHANPELGFQEVATAARLAKEMRALGFTVTEGVGKTGLVAVLKNGDGPKILVRTDMDALPMEEKTGLPYASHVKATWRGNDTFVAHSCGHDMHMTVWIGAARALVALKSQWKGTLIFVGQPSEEGVDGARAMLADGFIDRFGKADYGFALHVVPREAGTVGYKSGVLTATSDSLELTFNGRGAHGSMPSASIDPVMMAARFTVDVQSVISREKDPAAFGVVTVGSIQAGSAGNIIPDSAKIRGTIRSFDDAVRTKILAGVTRTALATAQMSDAPAPDLQIIPGGKAVINDDALTAKTVAVFKAAFGDKAEPVPAPGSGSEDYSEFILAGVPSVYFWLGGADPKAVAAAKLSGKPLPSNHSPYFSVLPEPTIRTGVEAMTLAVMNAAN